MSVPNIVSGLLDRYKAAHGNDLPLDVLAEELEALRREKVREEIRAVFATWPGPLVSEACREVSQRMAPPPPSPITLMDDPPFPGIPGKRGPGRPRKSP